MLVHDDTKIYNGNTQIIKVYQGADVIYEYPQTVHIYGVKRELVSTAPAWERLEDGIGLTANATHDGTSVINDFDSIYPWSNIISYQYDTANDTIVSYYGDSNFTFSPSDANIDILTKIPEFWWKRYQEDGYEYIYIADGAVEGFTKSNEFSIGRYFSTFSNQKAVSKSNNTPSHDYLVNARSYTTSKNNNYCLLDWHYFVIQLLYIVEYANYNSQSILGTGIQDNAVHSTGGCDTLGMKSGCLINTGSGSVIYRGIEDIFGHFFNTLDGIFGRAGGRMIDFSYNPDDYATMNNFSSINWYYPEMYNWPTISVVGCDANNPLIQIPEESAGSKQTTKYTCDGAYTRGTYSNLRLVEFGGATGMGGNNAGANGLWCCATVNNVDTSNYSDMGYRILKYK